MFGSLIKQSARDNVTSAASIPPTNTGSPVQDLMKKNAVELVKNQAEPESVPIRTSAYAQLVVNSTDRYNSFIEQLENPTTSSNWILQRPNYLLQGYFYRIGISQVQIQWNLNTICNSLASGVTIGNDILTYGLTYTNTTTSQTIDTTGGSVTLTVTAGLPFTAGDSVEVTSGVNSFDGLITSYIGTALSIGTLTNIVGTYPATGAWTIVKATAYTTTLRPGFYNPTQLAANIQAQMNADIGSAVITVAYGLPSDPYTANVGVFTFTCAAGYKISFGISTTGSGSVNTPNRTLFTLGVNSFNFSPAQIQVFSPPIMSYTRFIDLCSSTLTKFQRVKDATTLPSDSHTATIARIYLTPGNQSQSSGFGAGVQAGLPFNFTVDFETVKWCKWSPSEVLSNFDLQIRDEYGALLYWTPNCGIEYQFTLLASET